MTDQSQPPPTQQVDPSERTINESAAETDDAEQDGAAQDEPKAPE